MFRTVFASLEVMKCTWSTFTFRLTSRAPTNNHIPKRDRKLLLKKQELRKWKTRMEEKGLSIVLTRLFIDDSGHCKAEIALGRGKKLHDKRDSIKERTWKENEAAWLKL
jgi:SsrA-binding protein